MTVYLCILVHLLSIHTSLRRKLAERTSIGFTTGQAMCPMTVDEKMLFFVELYRIKMSLQNNIKAARKLRAA